MYSYLVFKIKQFMLNNLLDLIKENVGNAIINNPLIPNEKNEEAVSLASNSIIDGLKNAIGGGNIFDLVGMFSSGNAGGTNVEQPIQSGFVEKLTQKLGIDSSLDAGIASSLIPSVLNQFFNKTKDPNDSSFDLNNIIWSLRGFKNAGGKDVQGILN